MTPFKMMRTIQRCSSGVVLLYIRWRILDWVSLVLYDERMQMVCQLVAHDLPMF